MSNHDRTNGPPTAGYPSYRQPGAAWTAADAIHDTGPIPRQSGVPGGGAVGAAAGGAVGARRQSVDVAKALGLVVATLGGLNFLWGFLPELTSARSQDSLSVFAVGPAYVPVLLLIGGLLALAALLPGSEVSRLATAAVSVGGAAGAIVSLGTQGAVQLVSTTQVSKGMGAILLVVFGIIQAVVAIGAYVVGADGLPSRGGRAASRTQSPRADQGPAVVGAAAGQNWAAPGWAAPGWAGPGGAAPGGAGPGWAAPGGAAGSGAPAGGGYGAGAGLGSLAGGGQNAAAGGVQPGWYGPAQQWPADDSRNAPADERPTGPQQVVMGAESRREEPPATPAGPSTDPGAQVHPDKSADPSAAGSEPAPSAGSTPAG